MNQERTEILKMIKFLRGIGVKYISRGVGTVGEEYLQSNDEYTLQELVDIANKHGLPLNKVVINIDGDSDVTISKRFDDDDYSYHRSLRNEIYNAIRNHYRDSYIALSGKNCYLDHGRMSLISYYALNKLPIPEWLYVENYTTFNVDELVDFTKQVFKGENDESRAY